MDIKNDGYPENLEEAIETILDFEPVITKLALSKDSVEGISEEETKSILSFLHHSIGQFIRNSWFLWWTEGHGYKEGWPPGIV